VYPQRVCRDVLTPSPPTVHLGRAEQQPVALAPAGTVAFVDVVAVDRLEQPGELAPVEHVGECVRLLRGAQDARWVALEHLVLDQEAEEPFESGDGAGLAWERRPSPEGCAGYASPYTPKPAAPAEDIAVSEAKAYEPLHLQF
jgi:hypothetical protein